MLRRGLGLALLLLPLRAWSQCSSTWHCPGEGSGTTHSFGSMSECQAKVEEALFAWKHLGGGGCTATECSCSSGGSSGGSGSEAAAAAAQAREYVNQLEGRNSELRGRVQDLEGRKEELTRKKKAVEEKKQAREAEWRERQRLWDLKDAKDELGKGLKPGMGGGLETGFKDFIAEAENNRRWEKHRHAVLALQREATAKNPANRENETWCKLNTLLAPGPERGEAWDRRCDPGRRAPPYVAAAPRLEPAFKGGAAPQNQTPPTAPTPRGAPAPDDAKSALLSEFKAPEPEEAPAGQAPAALASPEPEGAEPPDETVEGPSGLPENASELAGLRPGEAADERHVVSDEDARSAASSGFDDGGRVLTPEVPEPPPVPDPTPAQAPGPGAAPVEEAAAAAPAPVEASAPVPLAAVGPAPETPKTVMHCAGSECAEQRVIAALPSQTPAARLQKAADCAAGPFIARLSALGARGEELSRAFRASVALVLEALKDAEVSAPALDDASFSVDGKEVQVVSQISGSKTPPGGDIHLDLQWSVNQDGVESEESALVYIKPDGTVYGQASAAIEECLARGFP